MRGIYKITCKYSTRTYIGSSVNIERRFFQHIQDLSSGKHSNKRLQNDYTKFGRDSFEFKLVEELSEANRDTLYNREQYYLDTIFDKYNVLTDARAHLVKRPNLTLAINGLTVAQQLDAKIKLLKKGKKKKTSKVVVPDANKKDRYSIKGRKARRAAFKDARIKSKVH